jgi:hypothetical protein
VPLAFDKKLAIALLLASAGAARANTPSADEDRFFTDKIDDDETADSTLWQGSLTSTSFLHRETAGVAQPLSNVGGVVGTENAADFLRLFTDLRAQLDGRHISGGAWDFRFDGRARYVPLVAGKDQWITWSPQSGTFGGNEYDLRELYVSHSGERTDLTIGRQYVLDLAAVKFDGLRLDYASSETWTYIGFAGLYPVRGSRSIDTDYPVGIDMAGNPAGRVLPVAGGLGAAYRTQKAYGALGVVGIAPLAKDRTNGLQEAPRAFATSNGYWRPSIDLDLYHYAVVDFVGSGGAALTNLSVGANWKPVPHLHVTAQVNSWDTETLVVQAQTQLNDPNQQLVGVVNNEIAVSRIASRSAHAGLSVALGESERYEISTAAELRERPDISLSTGTGNPAITLKAAESAELMLQATDRRSFGGLRLSVFALRAFGVGTSLDRTSTTVLRASAQRSFADDKGEWEADLGYSASKDDDIGVTCTSATLGTCWGASQVSTASIDGFAMYRLGDAWLGLASLELADQSLQTSNGATLVSQPAIIEITALLRLSYRF